MVAKDLLETQERMHVSLIQTARADFICCRTEDDIEVARAAREKYCFDYLPVVGDSEGEVKGILDCRHLSEASGTIGQRMRPLTSALVMSDRASIISFIQSATEEPFRIVVGEAGVTGLVSISDLQRLPVRAALFTYITAIELILGQEIERLHREVAEWIAKIDQGRRNAVLRLHEESVRDGRDVGHIAWTQLSDKFDVLATCDSWLQELNLSRRAWLTLKGRTVKLRDAVAHAAPFAVDQAHAERVCCIVERLGGLVDGLRAHDRERRLANAPSAPTTSSRSDGRA